MVQSVWKIDGLKGNFFFFDYRLNFFVSLRSRVIVISSNLCHVFDCAVLFGFSSSSNSCLGFYRGIAPGVTGSLATGATYFGVIESSKKWIEERHPNLDGHWVHFIAGAVGKQSWVFQKSLTFEPCRIMIITIPLLTKFSTDVFILVLL